MKSINVLKTVIITQLKTQPDAVEIAIKLSGSVFSSARAIVSKFLFEQRLRTFCSLTVLLLSGVYNKNGHLNIDNIILLMRTHKDNGEFTIHD
jgi:hypothetical protein